MIGRRTLLLAAAAPLAGCGMGWMFAGNLSVTDSRGVLGMLVALGIPLASSVNMILLKRRAHTVDLIPAVFLGGTFSALAMLPFLYNVYKTSLSEPVGLDDPWGWGRSLEWATSSPPPRHNFHRLPRIRSESPAFDLHHPEVAALEAGEHEAIAAGKDAH